MAEANVNPPSSLLIQAIENLRDNPDIFQAFRAIVDGYNNLLEYVTQQAAIGNPPRGTATVTAAALDGTIKLTWNNDESGATVANYGVWRADAGTRSSPTTPIFSAALRVDTKSAQEVSCLPVGSGYTWIDKNFTVTEKNPANPSRKSYWVTTIDNQDVESIGIPSGPIEVPLNGPGDDSPEPKAGQLNMLWNTAFYNTLVTTANRTVPAGSVVTNATNATPIVITTAGAHGLTTTDPAIIYGVVGNINANGFWTVTVVDATHFSLDTSVGSGGYTSGGLVFRQDGQPTPPTLRRTDKSPAWTFWAGAGTAAFVSDGTIASSEVKLTDPGAGSQTLIAQGLDPKRFSYSQHLTLSVYARRSSTTPSNTNLQLIFVGCPGGNIGANISGSLLTTSYQRFALNFSTPSVGTFDTITYVEVGNSNVSGTGTDIYITRPMLNAGDLAAGWTNVLDDGVIVGAQNTNYTSSAIIPTWSRTTSQQITRDSSVTYV